MPAEAFIELRAVSCSRAGASVDALSLGVAKGALSVLTGDAGCGKNLILRLLGLIEQPDAGEVFFDCAATSHLTDDARANVRTQRCGYLFPAPFLLPSFTVLENVAMPIFKILEAGPVEARERTEAVLKFVGLSEYADRRHVPPALAHRAALARALASSAEAIFVENLDTLLPPEELPAFRELLHSAARLTEAVIVATALPSLPPCYGERRIAITAGRIAS